MRTVTLLTAFALDACAAFSGLRNMPRRRARPSLRANTNPAFAIARGGSVALAAREAARDSLEAAAFGFVYAVGAALTGGWAERVFPAYDEKKDYTAAGLLVEISLQSAWNAAVAQLLRSLISHLPLLKGIVAENSLKGHSLPAAGGGIVFAFVTFSRQTQWKKKVAALDKLLDRTVLFS
mmetsp:Transcript_23294/g.69764  ORF Transcript_23294/g.69764 Transcript_23294/m.69764 type:complete len:180 (+) Transcript_23294:116-655(+)|eukprot:CAMPEP_0119282600 /NCGR_PEP_ID=MMETSP1329-20130426/27006_1 /TAXON_ID=114041 /ORGANISM="Genus nov. species nov., Strain RCC1024" /LENGTH=179 /DNA_ID=CAMNT_0007283263 /DNA_START=61 /DNA_END=600 /DNA_ORIENTATION=+